MHLVEGQDAVSGGTDDLDVVDRAEEHRQSLSDDRVVVHDQQPDHWVDTSETHATLIQSSIHHRYEPRSRIT
jgi:hypothetical protein